MKKVEIFTQGVISGKIGGYGVIVRENHKDIEFHGEEHDTTLNRLELIAAITGFLALAAPSEVLVITTSEYLQKGMTSWISSWKYRNWITSSKTPVKNADLWKILDELVKNHHVTWRYIPSHNTNSEYGPIHTLANKWRVTEYTVKIEIA